VIELRRCFESNAEFETWTETQAAKIKRWQAAVVNDARRFGVFEPISNRHFAPVEIDVDLDRLIVSLSAGHLNSRKRAGLLALDAAVKSLPGRRSNSVKILAAEAVTPVASILRAEFPYLLCTEFIPEISERDAQFPVTHLDLTAIELPGNSFDVFFSAHVLEHVPEISNVLDQVHHVLSPGGLLVSTFPFHSNRAETVTKARLTTQGVEHLAEPEYHGNPMNTESGSLVFELPGWDILDQAREVGYSKAALMVMVSSRYGVVSNDRAGVFALIAQKATGRDCQYRLPRLEYEGAYF